MNTNWSKIKGSKALKIALIIAVPTILVAGYYGYKFVKKKFDKNTDGELKSEEIVDIEIKTTNDDN